MFTQREYDLLREALGDYIIALDNDQDEEIEEAIALDTKLHYELKDKLIDQ